MTLQFRSRRSGPGSGGGSAGAKRREAELRLQAEPVKKPHAEARRPRREAWRMELQSPCSSPRGLRVSARDRRFQPPLRSGRRRRRVSRWEAVTGFQWSGSNLRRATEGAPHPSPAWRLLEISMRCQRRRAWDNAHTRSLDARRISLTLHDRLYRSRLRILRCGTRREPPGSKMTGIHSSAGAFARTVGAVLLVIAAGCQPPREAATVARDTAAANDTLDTT